ncbi:MAG TPA: hypothetical protein VK031_07285 [Tissierellaceae bacterium]|nr:hypothetical protein [Tissierellaceae bacterium]
MGKVTTTRTRLTMRNLNTYKSPAIHIHHLSDIVYNENKGNIYYTPSASSYPEHWSTGRSEHFMIYKMNNSDIQFFFNRVDAFIKFAPINLKDEFLREMAEVLKTMHQLSELSLLEQFVEEWMDTVYLYSNPDTIREIEEAEEELAKGEGVEWYPGMYIE